MNSVSEGEHVEEFEDSLMLAEGDFYQLKLVEYRVEKPSHQTEFIYDMLNHLDLLFRNELDVSREYVSLSEALDSFMHKVQDE